MPIIRSDESPAARRWKAALLIALMAVLLFTLTRLPLREWIGQVEEWVTQMGALGIALFVLAYVAATMLFIPTWFFTLVAGALFGVLMGLPLVVGSALLGATGSFLLARYAVRRHVEHWFEKNNVLQAVNKALEEKGWKVVTLVRMSPLVPFGVQNYFLGLTRVDLAHYVLATVLGVLPATLLYLFIGSTGRDAMTGGSTAKWALLGAGIAATIAVTWIVTRAARKQLGIDSK